MEKRIAIILLAFSVLIFRVETLNSQVIPWWKVIYNYPSDVINMSRFYPKLLRVLDRNTIGFASGSLGALESYLVITTNTGKNWDTVYSSLPEKTYSFEFVDWCFKPEKQIYCAIDSIRVRGIIGLDDTLDYQTIILKSNDLGKTWNRIIISNEFRTRPTETFYMLDSINGIIIQRPTGVDTTDRILMTNDGWNSFYQAQNDLNIRYSQNVLLTKDQKIIIETKKRDLYFLDSIYGSWRKLELPIEIKNSYNTTNDFKFYNDSIFFFMGVPVSGNYRFVAKSTDAGKTWNKIFESFSKDTQIVNLSFYNDSILYINGKHLIHTSNNGKIWTEEYVYHRNYKSNPNEIAYLFNSYRVGLKTPDVFLFDGDKILKPPDFTLPDPKIRWHQPLDFTIAWTKIDGATRYHLQVVEGAGVVPGDPPEPFNFDTTLFVNDSMLVDTSYNMTDTHYFKTYYMRIRALNDSMASEWLGDYHTTVEFNDVNDNEKLNKNDFSVYPNPFSSTFFIEFKNEIFNNIKVELYNLLGEKILSKNFAYLTDKSPITLINTKDVINNGCYILVVDNGSYILHKKIIKIE